MNLREAIAHALDVADHQGCSRCADDHRKLAAWLYELQMWREHPWKMMFLSLSKPWKREIGCNSACKHQKD